MSDNDNLQPAKPDETSALECASFFTSVIGYFAIGSFTAGCLGYKLSPANFECIGAIVFWPFVLLWHLGKWLCTDALV